MTEIGGQRGDFPYYKNPSSSPKQLQIHKTHTKYPCSISKHINLNMKLSKNIASIGIFFVFGLISCCYASAGIGRARRHHQTETSSMTGSSSGSATKNLHDMTRECARVAAAENAGKRALTLGCLNDYLTWLCTYNHIESKLAMSKGKISSIFMYADSPDKTMHIVYPRETAPTTPQDIAHIQNLAKRTQTHIPKAIMSKLPVNNDGQPHGYQFSFTCKDIVSIQPTLPSYAIVLYFRINEEDDRAIPVSLGGDNPAF